MPKLLSVLCPEESLIHSSAQIVSKHLVSATLGRAGMGQSPGALRYILEKMDWGSQALKLISPREIPNWVVVIKYHLLAQTLKKLGRC